MLCFTLIEVTRVNLLEFKNLLWVVLLSLCCAFLNKIGIVTDVHSSLLLTNRAKLSLKHDKVFD